MVTKINSIFHRETDEEYVMHSRSVNIGLMINDKEDELLEELVTSLLSRYEKKWKTSMKVSGFIFDCVNIL